MFVHEEQPTERQMAQKQTDQMIEEKLGSSGIFAKTISMDQWNNCWSYNKFFKRKMVLKLL